MPPCSMQVCSPKAQRDNLLSFYARTAGWGWKRNDGWTDAVVRGTAAPVFSAAVNCVSPVAGVVLPDHCCFYGVECCDREQCPPMASFLDTSCDCECDLARPWLSEIFSPAVAWLEALVLVHAHSSKQCCESVTTLTACQSDACTGKLGTVTALRLDYNNVSILVAAGVAEVTLKRLQQAAQAYRALHVQL